MTKITHRSLIAAKFVDVVVEEFVYEVNVREEHSSAAVAGESQSIQNLSHVDSLLRISVLVSFSNESTKLFPAMSYDFSATEAPDGNYHVESIIITKSQNANVNSNAYIKSNHSSKIYEK